MEATKIPSKYAEPDSRGGGTSTVGDKVMEGARRK
jgi:hypothetical protein